MLPMVLALKANVNRCMLLCVGILTPHSSQLMLRCYLHCQSFDTYCREFDIGDNTHVCLYSSAKRVLLCPPHLIHNCLSIQCAYPVDNYVQNTDVQYADN